MSTELATVPTGVSTLARAVNVDPRELVDALKTQIMPNAKDAELMAFCMVANKYGLDPFMKQVYAVRKNGSGAYEAWISVDGWYAIVERHPDNDGVEFEEHRDNGEVVAITCRMFRKSRTRPVVVTEYMSECRKDSKPWESHPIRMLRHRTFMQAARVCYAIAEAGADDPADVPHAPPPQSGVVSVPALDDLRSALDEPEVIEAEVESIDSLISELVELNAKAGHETTPERVTTSINREAKKEKRDPIDIARERVAKARKATSQKETES